GHGYPHYCLVGETPKLDGREALAVSGWRAQPFLQEVSTNNVAALQPGQSQRSLLLDKNGKLIDDIFIKRLEADEIGRDRYIVLTNPQNHERVKMWFHNLSDGYVIFDEDDIFAKIEGPVTVVDLLESDESHNLRRPGLEFRDSLKDIQPLCPASGNMLDGTSLYKVGHQDLFHLSKPYFIGQKNLEGVRPNVEKEEFKWEEVESEPKRTCLYEEHLKLTKKIIPFAGWEMPVWYTSVGDEHRAVRETAALFDVSHMGVFEITGEHATSFLDIVCSNYVRWYDVGQAFYSYLLDPDGNVIDDVFVYRRGPDLYLMVVNAANEDKDWAWLNAVNEGEVLIDRDHPDKAVEGKAILRNLKDPSSGQRQKIDIALQGPNSLAILQSLTHDEKLKDKLARIRRTGLIETELGGFELVIARTGYTGEDIGYEIFVHPSGAPALWNLLLRKGEPFGIKPAGLGARDSTRTEAGLPLYGHELAGPFNIDPVAAGFGSFVKLHKPYFIGRKAFIEKALGGKMEIVRFRMNEKGVRMPAMGDPVVNRKGKYIGAVTSCAIDSEGFLLGTAYVDKRYNKEGTQIGVFALPHGKIPAEKPKDKLGEGDQVLLHNWATVLTRFLERKNSA
ncbi:MAG: glycine cleavage system aminomethyltransferase GcvT, partial [Anaerolineae bacterium]